MCRAKLVKSDYTIFTTSLLIGHIGLFVVGSQYVAGSAATDSRGYNNYQSSAWQDSVRAHRGSNQNQYYFKPRGRCSAHKQQSEGAYANQLVYGEDDDTNDEDDDTNGEDDNTNGEDDDTDGEDDDTDGEDDDTNGGEDDRQAKLKRNAAKIPSVCSK